MFWWHILQWFGFHFNCRWSTLCFPGFTTLDVSERLSNIRMSLDMINFSTTITVQQCLKATNSTLNNHWKTKIIILYNKSSQVKSGLLCKISLAICEKLTSYFAGITHGNKKLSLTFQWHFCYRSCRKFSIWSESNNDMFDFANMDWMQWWWLDWCRRKTQNPKMFFDNACCLLSETAVTK